MEAQVRAVRERARAAVIRAAAILAAAHLQRPVAALAWAQAARLGRCRRTLAQGRTAGQVLQPRAGKLRAARPVPSLVARRARAWPGPRPRRIRYRRRRHPTKTARLYGSVIRLSRCRAGSRNIGVCSDTS